MVDTACKAKTYVQENWHAQNLTMLWIILLVPVEEQQNLRVFCFFLFFPSKLSTDDHKDWQVLIGRYSE